MLSDFQYGFWYAEQFSPDDLAASAAWLRRQGLVDGIVIDQDEKIPFVGTWWGQATALGLAALVGAGATILGTFLLAQPTATAPHVRLSVSVKSPPNLPRPGRWLCGLQRSHYWSKSWRDGLALQQAID